MRRAGSTSEPLLARASAPPPAANPLGPFPPPPLGLETDPFFVFRDELGLATRTCLARFERWQDLLQHSSTADAAFHEENTALRKSLAQIQQNVAHLERVVSLVERKRADFPAISDHDLAERRRFLHEVQQRVGDMNAAVTAPEMLRKLEMDKMAEAEARRKARSATVVPAVASTASSRRPDYEDEESLDASHRLTHDAILKEQDVVLDEISASLGNLSTVSREIHTEVNAHSRMLDDMHAETGSVMGGLDGAMGRLDLILHSPSRGTTCGIVFLVVVLLVLIMLVALL